MGTIQLIDSIKPYPLSFDEEDWYNPLGIQRKRQLTIFRDCDTIPLMWKYAKGKPHQEAPKTEFYDKYYDREWFHDLYTKLFLHYGYGKPISVLFARLRAGGELVPHIDGGISVVHNHDVHIPITTNKGCIFTVGDEQEHLEVGKIYEVDNTVTHSVSNGNEPRIHLIVEWYNPEEVKGYYEEVESVFGDGKIYRIWKKK